MIGVTNSQAAELDIDAMIIAATEKVEKTMPIRVSDGNIYHNGKIVATYDQKTARNIQIVNDKVSINGEIVYDGSVTKDIPTQPETSEPIKVKNVENTDFSNLEDELLADFNF